MKPETQAELKRIFKTIGGGKEEAIAQAISDLSDEGKLEFFTWIFPQEDETLSMMSYVADRYGLTWLQKFVTMKLRLRTSLNGWRANQIVQIASETRKEKQANWFMRNIFKRGETKKQKEVEEFE